MIDVETIDLGKDWLEELLYLMGIDALVSPLKIEEDDRSCWLVIDKTNLTPKQIQILIGEKGHAIDAIQYLTNTLVNMDCDRNSQKAYTVEIDGYRYQRQEELFQMVERVAQQVRSTGKEKEIKNLSSAERRQIHSFLENSKDLQTESRGQEPDRRLIIRLR